MMQRTEIGWNRSRRLREVALVAALDSSSSTEKLARLGLMRVRELMISSPLLRRMLAWSSHPMLARVGGTPGFLATAKSRSSCSRPSEAASSVKLPSLQIE